jgi:hypothetical protein
MLVCGRRRVGKTSLLLLSHKLLTLILSGSRIGTIVEQLEHRAPLYRGITAQLSVEPLPYATLQDFFLRILLRSSRPDVTRFGCGIMSGNALAYDLIERRGPDLDWEGNHGQTTQDLGVRTR